MVKKVLLADSIALYADSVFNAAEKAFPLSGAEAWLGSLCYTFQLYFDFSGYTDMAIGLALMLGLRLPENFDSPYKSTGIVDFWRRWHITLSSWLRDFLYIPLGGNRKGRLMREALRQYGATVIREDDAYICDLYDAAKVAPGARQMAICYGPGKPGPLGFLELDYTAPNNTVEGMRRADAGH